MTQVCIGRNQRAAALTKRQAEVLECVANRLTLKETAGRLEISESAVNSHIKALKQQLAVNSLSELAELWRNFNDIDKTDGYRISACRNSGLADQRPIPPRERQDGDESRVLTFAEPMVFHQQAPWENLRPEIVPGVLRGINAKWNRAAVIVLIAMGILALVMLGLGVGQGIHAALSGLPTAPPTHI